VALEDGGSVTRERSHGPLSSAELDARRRDTRRPFADQVEGFGHTQLASQPSYRRFREALAELVDECDAPLGRLLSDVRHATISSPFGAMCSECRATSWPSRGNRRGGRFVGHYVCPCGRTFTAAHDIADVNWPNG
jgi:hypothetical protein